MQVKRKSEKTTKPTRRLPRSKWLWVGGVAALFCVAIASFLLGAKIHATYAPTLAKLTGKMSLQSALMSAPKNYYRSIESDVPLQRMHLDIKFRHLSKLRQKRAEALKAGVLISADDDEVPAKIRINGRTVNVRIRLKGDWTDHLKGKKWSFRIKVRRDDQIFQMRRFSIQDPATRGYQSEALFLAHLRKAGIVAPRYFFVDLTVNGEHIGIMAVEEHFSKELLESQGRRESVILKFDESDYWMKQRLDGMAASFDSYLNTRAIPFRQNKIKQSETLTNNLKIAAGLIQGFSDGSLSASQVFNVDIMARFLAIAELWSSWHVIDWNNLRFYFEPISAKLEPVGFDANVHRPYLKGHELMVYREPFMKKALDDPAFDAAFVRALRHTADEILDGKLIAHLRELETKSLLVLHREVPFLAAFDFSRLQKRARKIRAIYEGRFPRLAHVRILREDRKFVVELANATPLPVEIVALQVSNAAGEKVAHSSVKALPLRLPPTGYNAQPAWNRVALEPDNDSDEVVNVTATAKVVGSEQSYDITSVPHTPTLEAHPLTPSTRDELLRDFAFLQWDGQGEQFVAKRGTWRINKPLILPPGVGIRLEPATVLRFAPGTYIIASGPVDLLGTATAPIVLEGLSDESRWGGIAVHGSARTSHWRNVKVRNTSGFSLNNWAQTAGVLFWKSEAQLEDSVFRGNATEDALNIVNGQFSARNIRFVNTLSDALDVDFGVGDIRESHFEGVGGDGIDVSGSTVTVASITFHKIGDKAVSVGEGSTLKANDIRVTDAGTGFVAKDLSNATLVDATFDGIRHIALMAYIKKREYGPATLEASDITFTATSDMAFAQTGSRLTLNGEAVPPKALDVDALYSTGSMKK